jgi:hypothetical protein
LDRINWFNNLETKADMNSCAIGIIGKIMDEKGTHSQEKVSQIAITLRGLKAAWNAKKTPAVTEVEGKILHPDCIVNVTKKQSFLEPWYLERIMREKG